MKNFFLFAFLLISFLSFSQRNRGYNRMDQYNSREKPEKVDPVKASLDYLTKELTLDTFQEAAVKSFIEESIKEKESIYSLDISSIDKGEKLRVSSEKMEAKINVLLNEKQKVAFKKLKEQRTKGSKKKKRDNKEELEIENQ